MEKTMATKKIKPVSDVFEFDDTDDEEFGGMPEFNQPDNGATRQIIISFDDQEGVDKFAKLIKQNITKKTKSIWYPPREKNNVVDLFWFDETDEREFGDDDGQS
jgi:hypothetical protein